MTGISIAGRALRSLAGMTALSAIGLTACSERITGTSDAPVIQGSSAELALSTPTGVIEQTKDRQPPKVCSALGYPYSAGPYTASGTYPFGDGRITVLLNSDGSVSWSTNFEGAALVLIHGGNRYNTYAGSTSGTGIAAPNASGKPAGFSNLVLCMGKPPALRGAVSTSTTFTRQFDWSIAKKADRASLTLDEGATATLSFGVSLGNTPTDRDHMISGTLTITNVSWLTANVTGVSLNVDGVGTVATTCTGTFSIVGAGGASSCAFTTPAIGGGSRAITATFTTTGLVAGGSATTTADFGDPTTLIDPSVTVTDRDSTWTATSGGSNFFTYVMTAGPYKCLDKPTVDNTASFAAVSGASGSANASVPVGVTCAPPPKDPPKPPPAPVYLDGGTAYAQGGTCFLDIPSVNGNNWGWSIPLTEGTHEFPLMMGAGRCLGGTQVGTVRISVRDGFASVVYYMTGSYRILEAHTYAASTQLTSSAPGQYGNVSGKLAIPADKYGFSIGGLTGETVFFAVHAHIVIVQ
jgi:hypothetical protein